MLLQGVLEKSGSVVYCLPMFFESPFDSIYIITVLCSKIINTSLSDYLILTSILELPSIAEWNILDI